MRSFGRPLVHNRCVPHSAIGTTGTPASAAIRTAPDLMSFTVNDRLIVASGNTPTTSPAFRRSTASRYEARPAPRSTEMWCMPRMSGPATRLPKISFFAMNRTRRFAGCAPSPQKMKSR